MPQGLPPSLAPSASPSAHGLPLPPLNARSLSSPEGCKSRQYLTISHRHNEFCTS